ncbi:winged helix-turn-helix domain-containing tetratricopeptide repeat protein [Parasphingorhabdus sp.]|uniref:winged helix-turn-helix domain-containing tetratricopeptide repeat protein n=1 Tax=Parasphingorhabdus sp. TaxID=2709688 RepID=UPI003C713710
MTNATLSGEKGEPDDQRLDGTFFVNDIAANKFDHSLSLDDQVEHVEPKVMDLLVQLAAAPRQPVNRSDLLDAIWPDGGGGDESLTRLVYQLRRAFKSFPSFAGAIKTVSKFGYRLDASVKGLAANKKASKLFAAPTREYNLSIAILPIADHNADAENRYLADGMSRDLTSLLATTPMLFVTPHSSVLALSDDNMPLATIAETLGCRFLLSGSFRRQGNEIRLRFELVDTIDSSLAWSEKYNTVLDQFFEVQSDVLLNVSTAISARVRFALEPPAVARRPFQNDVYRILQTAETLRYSYGKDSALEITRLLREGLKITPDHAALRAGLAVQLSQNVVSQWEDDPKAAEQIAFEHIEAALAKEPANAEVIAAAGIVNAMFHRQAEAIGFLRRAVEMDPNNAHALAMLGWQMCLVESDPNGIALIESAEYRAPHHPRFGLWATYRATGHLFLLHYASAVPACKQAISRTPNYYQPRLSLAWALLGLGDRKGAETAIREAEKFEGTGIARKFAEEVKQWTNNSPNAAECATALDNLIPLSGNLE